tara:strand:+ start:362 stop:772 length:411 start_codon:yes stop_codon:yes gene_type:complete
MYRSSIDYAEDLVFSFEDESVIHPGFLQTIDYSGLRPPISYQMNEFTAFCPFLGLPDTGIVCVDYILNKKLFELKTLKYYFISFTNVGNYQEDLTSRIFNDLTPLMVPEEFQIETLYSTRGGIGTTCTINSNEQKY